MWQNGFENFFTFEERIDFGQSADLWLVVRSLPEYVNVSKSLNCLGFRFLIVSFHYFACYVLIWKNFVIVLLLDWNSTVEYTLDGNKQFMSELWYVA